MEPDVDDAFLVQRAQEGYLDAYSELVSRHGALAYRVALRMLGDHHDAEDVAQEALVAAWQQLPRFKAESSFTTWLYRIVTRRALNRITRTQATDSVDLLGHADEAGRPGPYDRTEPRHRRGHPGGHGVATRAADRRRAAPLRRPVLRRDRPHHRQHGTGRPQPSAPRQAHTVHNPGGVEVTHG